MKKTGSLEQALKKYAQKKMMVRVGFIDGAKYPGDNETPVAQVAFWNEYGTSSSPPRPFFRNAINTNKKKWVGAVKALIKNGGDTYSVLNEVGKIIQEDIVTSILEMTDPPNSEVTALLKDRFPMNPQDITKADYYKAVRDVQNGKTGGNHRKPLVWTGDMIDRISYEVAEDES